MECFSNSSCLNEETDRTQIINYCISLAPWSIEYIYIRTMAEISTHIWLQALSDLFAVNRMNNNTNPKIISELIVLNSNINTKDS